MLLGASALGQFALGGTGYEAVGGINYVNIAAPITITSNIAAAIQIVGRVELSASVAITSSISAALSITGAAGGTVSISASIAMVSALTAAFTAAAAMPDPGVSFTLSDKAGGA